MTDASLSGPRPGVFDVRIYLLLWSAESLVRLEVVVTVAVSCLWWGTRYFVQWLRLPFGSSAGHSRRK